MHGHDFYSHHRRWNPGHPLAVKLGFTTIFARYALDLVPVDADNAMRSNHSNTNADFVGWGAPIAAPGDGLVVAAHDQEADDDIATGKSTFDPARLATEPLEFYGNYLIIDHGNGEFSLLGHLRQGSLTVKRGERVKRGQLVAAIGASGSAEFTPHLHYELRTGTTMSAEGLPAYFRGLTLLRGSAAQRIAIGPLNSGDFVIARP
jgi:murein DD-endopeptidase MepM/ murein hydrolase activator NlpD